MSLTDYSDIEKEISTAPDPKVLPKGTECKARIVRVNTGISDKNDARWYSVGFDVPEEPMCIEFQAFFWDLADKNKLDDKASARAFSSFKQFAAAFGLDYSKPFSWTDDLVGLTGWMIVGVKDDPEYGPKNTVSKWVSGAGKPNVATGAGREKLMSAQAVAGGRVTTDVNDDIPF